MTLRLGVVGVGRRGHDWIRTIHQTAGFELAACVDADPAALRHAGPALSVPSDRCHTSLEVALDTTQPDALIVATPLAAAGMVAVNKLYVEDVLGDGGKSRST